MAQRLCPIGSQNATDALDRPHDRQVIAHSKIHIGQMVDGRLSK